MVLRKKKEEEDGRFRKSAFLWSAPSIVPRIPRLLWLLLFLLSRAMATDITWTPNPDSDDAGGPLPLSMKQRQQLLQLEQTILSSSDPDATLAQVAASNDMSAADLFHLLQRNHADMVEKGGGSTRRRSNTITTVLWNGMMGVWGILWQCTRSHPRLATLALLSLLSVWYILWIAIPQTGLVINADHPRGLWTRGPTTLFRPPRSFVLKLLDQSQLILERDDDDERAAANDLWECVDWDHILSWNDAEDMVTQTWSPDRKTKSPRVQRVTVSQQMIDIAELARKISKLGRQNRRSTQTDPREEDSDLQESSILDACLSQAASICQTPRDITAGIPGNPQSSVQFITDPEGNPENGILIVPGMGDWGRYGLLPIHIEPMMEDDDLSLTLTVAAGGHWDGQIHISVVPFESKEESVPNRIAVRVSIIVPVRGQAPSPRIAEQITEEIARSMGALIQIRTQQSRARSRQSQLYSQSAHDRAQYRRTHRSHLERQMEDMAAERRRRWQRKNPGGSNYRPSGERMRNPNSAVSFR